MSSSTKTQLAALEDIFADMGSVAVAFSGGVDSTLVAVAAHRVLGPKALAVTAVSPALAKRELEESVSLAEKFGFAHRIINTNEMEREGYVANSPQRCYFCKTELYSQLTELADKEANQSPCRVKTCPTARSIDSVSSPSTRKSTDCRPSNLTFTRFNHAWRLTSEPAGFRNSRISTSRGWKSRCVWKTKRAPGSYATKATYPSRAAKTPSWDPPPILGNARRGRGTCFNRTSPNSPLAIASTGHPNGAKHTFISGFHVIALMRP